jgi:hypothetical protein
MTRIDQWPPDPATIDLSGGEWLTPKQAEGVALVSERTIWRRIAEQSIAIKIGGRVWVNRRRLMAPNVRP